MSITPNREELRTTNEKVYYAFMNENFYYTASGKKRHSDKIYGNSIKTIETDTHNILYSYQEEIASYNRLTETYYINLKYVSTTTSTHQNNILSRIANSTRPYNIAIKSVVYLATDKRDHQTIFNRVKKFYDKKEKEHRARTAQALIESTPLYAALANLTTEFLELPEGLGRHPILSIHYPPPNLSLTRISYNYVLMTKNKFQSLYEVYEWNLGALRKKILKEYLAENNE